MKKSEIYNALLGKVSEVCEVPREAIIKGSKFHAVLEARVLAVQYMRRSGLSFDDIALLSIRDEHGDASYCPPLKDLKARSKNIAKTFSSYSIYCLDSYAFCLMSEEIRDYCRKQYEQHYGNGMKPLPPTTPK